jgi:signal transduction histidine kinase
VHGLRPPALDDLGFLGAVTLQVDRVAGDAGVAVQLSVPAASLTLPAAVEVAAFHTIAEAITNVVRHSDATVVHVAVSREPSRLTVTVADNGRATPDWLPGVGLRSMRERAEELAGSLRATSGTAGGEVHVTYPLTTVSTVA